MKTSVLSFFLVPISAFAAGDRITAREVIERIQKNLGVEWRTETVDTFKAGEPDTPVTGVATTFIASMDVLKRAAAADRNLIITHEPTFYNHFDRLGESKQDALVSAKLAFIKEHGLVIWRFHDHWHMRNPDGIVHGMAGALGWTKYQSPDQQLVFVMPETTVGRLAAQIKDRLKVRSLRVVGDPNMKVTRVGFSPGASGSTAHLRMLASESIDAVVAGETTEWQAVEYARDAAAAGRKKAFLLLGHVVSEEAGMQYLAEWLRQYVKEVPVEFIPAGEPFWSPK